MTWRAISSWPYKEEDPEDFDHDACAVEHYGDASGKRTRQLGVHLTGLRDQVGSAGYFPPGHRHVIARSPTRH